MNTTPDRQAFDSNDFKGSGQYILRVSTDTSVQYMSTVLWKVCFSLLRYYLVSMTDGMISRSFESKDALCQHLNNDKHGYRFATERELSMLVAYIGTRRTMTKDVRKEVGE